VFKTAIGKTTAVNQYAILKASFCPNKRGFFTCDISNNQDFYASASPQQQKFLHFRLHTKRHKENAAIKTT
jgi:hypothetical protein